MKNTRQYFLGYVNNIPDRFCSSTKTILNRVLVTHNNSNFGAIFLINNLFSTFLKHALQTNRMTPILTWIMYPRIAPVVSKLSPTVDIFFIILSCLLEKGIEIEVPRFALNANSYSHIYIQLRITIHLKTLSKSFFFKIKPYFLLNCRGHGSKRAVSSYVLVRFTFLPNR